VEDWHVVAHGHSDTVVRRSPDGRCFAKSATDSLAREELAHERDRLAWLGSAGLETAEVVDWHEDAETSTLVTGAVPGMPASQVPAYATARVTSSIAMYLTDLHDLDVDDCPFDRRLDVTLPQAAERVDAGLVDESDFDLVRLGRSAMDVFDELAAGGLRASLEENLDLVVCHGDFCLDNVLVDPETYDVTGVVDVSRLGLADCHADLALMTRSMESRHLNPQYGHECAARFLATYPVEAERWRLHYYQLLDEFF